MILEAEADLVPMGPRSPLRSGRRRADIPRMSCGLRSAPVVAEQTSPGRLATHLPQGFGCCVAGAPWVQGLRSASVVAEQTFPGCLAVSAPLRSLQNRRPPDVLQPIFRTPSSALKWGKLNYTDFVQNCILDQKERTSL